MPIVGTTSEVSYVFSNYPFYLNVMPTLECLSKQVFNSDAGSGGGDEDSVML